MPDGVHILILNFNGRALLEECLPSVVAAAKKSVHPCRITVVDNSSSDNSIDYLRRDWPQVDIDVQPNRGLISFNTVVRRVTEPHILLLNNDVKLASDCIDYLISPLLHEADCFLTGPACWGFQGEYEGSRSALCFDRGLVHTRLQPGDAGLGLKQWSHTASAGAILAVDREKFLQLGGFDPLFLPGRYEDLDFAFRGWVRGWRAIYVPHAVAYHKRSATFTRRFKGYEINRLDARNALLFAWKNLQSGSCVLRHVGFLAVRLALSVLTSRTEFLSGFAGAVRHLPKALASRAAAAPRTRTEQQLFQLLKWQCPNSQPNNHIRH